MSFAAVATEYQTHHFLGSVLDADVVAVVVLNDLDVPIEACW